MPDLTTLIEDFKAHQLTDSLAFGKAEERDRLMADSIAELNSKVDGLATKNDIGELKQFLKGLNISIGIFKF